MLKRKNFRRAKVNCICRCTPKGGVTLLFYPFVRNNVNLALSQIYSSRSTGRIAATAVRTGEICEATNHEHLAIKVYKAAISAIQFIDHCRAEDYYNFGPLPPNPHHRYWSERINDADALEVAGKLDELYKRMGLFGYAHQKRKVGLSYEYMFRSVYSACL